MDLLRRDAQRRQGMHERVSQRVREHDERQQRLCFHRHGVKSIRVQLLFPMLPRL